MNFANSVYTPTNANDAAKTDNDDVTDADTDNATDDATNDISEANATIHVGAHKRNLDMPIELCTLHS